MKVLQNANVAVLSLDHRMGCLKIALEGILALPWGPFRHSWGGVLAPVRLFGRFVDHSGAAKIVIVASDNSPKRLLGRVLGTSWGLQGPS